MTEEIYDYTVRCKTCKKKFTVQLFDSHEKNLFVVDKKDWFCEPCKKDYFKAKTDKQTEAQKEIGFPPLSGTAKTASWGTNIRADMINKANYLRDSLTFETDEAKSASDEAFEALFKEWQEITTSKWWIDNRRMNVKDISTRLAEIKKEAGNS